MRSSLDIKTGSIGAYFTLVIIILLHISVESAFLNYADKTQDVNALLWLCHSGLITIAAGCLFLAICKMVSMEEQVRVMCKMFMTGAAVVSAAILVIVWNQKQSVIETLLALFIHVQETLYVAAFFADLGSGIANDIKYKPTPEEILRIGRILNAFINLCNSGACFNFFILSYSCFGVGISYSEERLYESLKGSGHKLFDNDALLNRIYGVLSEDDRMIIEMNSPRFQYFSTISSGVIVLMIPTCLEENIFYRALDVAANSLGYKIKLSPAVEKNIVEKHRIINIEKN